MGIETVKQLLARKPQFAVRMLARPSAKNKELVKKIADPYLEVIWGDMKDYETILRCVTGADYVLHIGAMVSPAADKYPEETLYTNIGSTLNIIKAIKEQPDPDKVKFAYVGTVAMTGDRPVPVNWGRCGDPINPSAHDYYAMSKVFSELSVFDSGLKYWVSIRQTGQYPPDQGAGEEPIQHHQNPNNVLEWSTAVESGICMANLCEDWVPEEFWRKAYNLSSGKGWRFAHWELMNFSFGPMGIRYQDVFDVTKCALYNFHGQYYTDSDLLDDYLHFRVIPPESYRAEVTAEMEAMMKNPMIAAMMPNTQSMKENLEKSAIRRWEPPGCWKRIRKTGFMHFSAPGKNSSRLRLWRKDMSFIILQRKIRFIWIMAMMKIRLWKTWMLRISGKRHGSEAVSCWTKPSPTFIRLSGSDVRRDMSIK